QKSDAALIISIARRKFYDYEFRGCARKAIEEHTTEDERKPDVIARFLSRLSYVALDASQDEGWGSLGEALESGEERVRVFYLATSPDLFGPICQRLGANKLVTERTRVVVEKPIGRDLESAETVNDTIGRVFPENRIFRIDHYLGKETVQNLMTLGLANDPLEQIWHGPH